MERHCLFKPRIDDYTEMTQIQIWENTGQGDFESIWKDEFEVINGDKKDDHSRTYFKIDYKNGIEVTNGEVANVKQEVGYVYEQNRPVYVFSLSSDAIQRVENGTYYIGNNTVIPLEDLVLLKVAFDSYDYNKKIVYLTILDVYDLGNSWDGVEDIDDFPPDYVNPDGGSASSNLVE